jgi:heme-degrading monooxygenase HmoA
MIARIWRGKVRSEDANEYADYMRATGVSEYTDTAGNQGVWMLRRDDGGLTEFLTFTLWESLEAVKRFAGDDYERAVYYPEDERYLVEQDPHVRHYEVVASD